MLNLFIYVALIAGANWLYDVVPMQQLPGGDLFSPASFTVGFVFIARDFAQRSVGHYVLLGMAAGIIISWWMATPQLAIASAAAFAVGELGDWALYTITRKPFSQRILLSSLLGAPLDSFVFLALVDIASILNIGLMSISKLASAILIFFIMRRRERFALLSQTT